MISDHKNMCRMKGHLLFLRLIVKEYTIKPCTCKPSIRTVHYILPQSSGEFDTEADPELKKTSGSKRNFDPEEY